VKKSAEQGHAPAQCSLGMMYGIGTSRSDEEAVVWYQRSALQSHAYGQFCLGFMYENGRGVVKNVEKAYFLYKSAAKQDKKEGIDNWNRMLNDGHLMASLWPRVHQDLSPKLQELVIELWFLTRSILSNDLQKYLIQALIMLDFFVHGKLKSVTFNYSYIGNFMSSESKIEKLYRVLAFL